MKKWGSLVLILLALALTAACALLPYAVSRMQDAYVQKQTESRSFDPVSLTLQPGGDVLTRLHDLSDGLDAMIWGGQTNLTPDDAAAAAKDTQWQLARGGFIPYVWRELDSPQYVEPRLMIADTGTPSAVVWVCSWDDWPGGTVLIDDESGKMMALECQLFQEAAVLPSPDNPTDADAHVSGSRPMELAALTDMAEKWIAVLSEYYGAEITLGEAEFPTEYWVTFPLYLPPQNGQDVFEIPLTFYGNSFIRFNM